MSELPGDLPWRQPIEADYTPDTYGAEGSIDDPVVADADMLPDRDYADNSIEYGPTVTVAERPSESSGRLRQIHLIDGEMYEGEHPDPQVQEAIRDQFQFLEDEYDKLHDLLSRLPNHNADVEDEIATAQAEIAEMFGSRAAVRPVTLVSHEAYAQVTAVIHGNPMVGGRYVHGEALVVVDNSEMDPALFGRRPIDITIRHELAHGVDPEPGWVVQTRPVGSHAPGTRDVVVNGHLVQIKPITGMHRPDSDMPLDKLYRGVFFEEGAADAFAYEKTHTNNPLWAARADNLTTTAFKHALRVTNDRNTPIVDPHTGSIAIPWKYVLGASVNADRTRCIRSVYSSSVMAAYSLDLLDRCALPDIQQQIADSKVDQSLRPLVRRRINSVAVDGEQPLYTSLSRLGLGSKQFEFGARLIIRALGIENARLGDIYGPTW